MSLEQEYLEKQREFDAFELLSRHEIGFPLPERSTFTSNTKVSVTQVPLSIDSFITTPTSIIFTPPVGISASASAMEGPTRYAPLGLPAILHDLPKGYSTRIKTFGSEEGIIAEHVDQFNDFIDLEEVDYEDVKMRLFV